MLLSSIYHGIKTMLGYPEKDRDLEPAIYISSAITLSVFFNILYIAPFYISRTLRPRPDLNRDDPRTIRARSISVVATCIICSAITSYVVRAYGHNDWSSTLRILGWWPLSLTDIARVSLLMVIWFVGPLFELGVVEGEWKRWITGRDAWRFLSSAIGFRNIVIGPGSEELIWRSLIIPLHLLASSDYPANVRQSTWSRINDLTSIHSATPSATRFTNIVIFTTPLYFGIAHLHHLYEFTLTHPHAPLPLAVLRTVVQFAYTTLFGWFEAYVFVRTGSLPAVVLAHAFCNWIGLPRFWGRVGQEVVESVTGVGRDGDDGVRDKDDGGERQSGISAETVLERAASRRKRPLGVHWTIAYYVLLAAGAYGFYTYLRPLTQSEHGLADA